MDLTIDIRAAKMAKTSDLSQTSQGSKHSLVWPQLSSEAKRILALETAVKWGVRSGLSKHVEKQGMTGLVPGQDRWSHGVLRTTRRCHPPGAGI